MRPSKPYKNSGYDVEEELTKEELDKQLSKALILMLVGAVLIIIGVGSFAYWIWG